MGEKQLCAKLYCRYCYFVAPGKRNTLKQINFLEVDAEVKLITER